MHRLILILAFHVFQGLLFSQEAVRTVHYSTREGMLSDVTYSAMFDRNGYLWICTDRGLSRFDGTDFTHFTINEGLPDNDVIYVTEDGKGTIWAQPFQREVVFLERDKVSFTNITTIIPVDTVRSDITYRVFALRDGGVGLLSLNGMVRVIKNKQWIASYHLSFSASIWRTFLYEDARNQLMVVTSGTTCTLHPDGGMDPVPNGLKIMRYEMIGNKIIAHLENDQLIQFDQLTGKRKVMHPVKGLHRFGIFGERVLYGDLSRNIALISFDSPEQKKDSLHVMLSCATDNADGTVQVICTSDEGIYVRTFHHQHAYTGLAEAPRYFHLDQGTPKVADAHQKIVFPLHSGSPKIDVSPPLIPLFEESFGQTMLSYGTRLMVYRSGKSQGDIEKLSGIKDIHLVNDSIRYLATQSGIYRFNKYTLAYKRLYKGRTTCVAEGAGGTLYIGTHWGLLELRKDSTVCDWTQTQGFPHIRITDIVVRDGVVWLATAGKGLLAICNRRISSVLNARDGISSNVITSITHAGGALFVGSPDGAQKITYAVRNDVPVIEKQIVLNTFRGEGIRSFFLWKEKLYAIGNHGVFVYDGHTEEPVKKFALRLTRVKINNQLREVLSRYNLDNDNYDFMISFSVINFEQFPLRCRYRINDGKWNYTSDWEILYRNQGSGTNRITIQVLNNYGFPSDTQVIVFDIRPPFFKQVWFIVTSVLFSIAFFFLLARFWFRRRFRAERESLLKENKLNELELIALKAQINPHFVFNCLNSIKGLIYEQQLEEADKYIDRFALLFRNTLEASYHTTHPVAAEMDYLQTYLELEQVSAGGRFHFEVTASFDTSTAYVPPMLLQPYVENAVKHGMSGMLEKRGEIKVEFHQEGNQLICTVADNGVGRVKAAQKRKLHAGKGIAITSRRAELHKIKIVISDNIPSGTLVTITVPLEQNKDK